MKPLDISVLGYDVTIQVPDSVEEFDTLAKKKDACLQEATMNVVYRGVSPVIRDNFITAVQKKTQFAFITKQVPTDEKDEAGNVKMKDVVNESEGRYFDRLLAHLVQSGEYTSEDAAHAAFKDLMVAAAADKDAAFDPSVTVREIKPKEPSKQAVAVINQVLASGKSATELAAKLTAKLREVKPDREEVTSDVKSLALAYMEHERNQADARRKAEVAALSV